jgi:ribosomal protein L11 methyltransferase
MYIWQKTVGACWLKSRGESLTDCFGPQLVTVERPGSKRVSVEISCSTRKQAQALQNELGGKMMKLQTDWLLQFAKKARRKPMRIGSRLVVLRSPIKTRAQQATPERPRSIIIPAETAFGTGEHATTAMCLRLLERITRCFKPGWSMLDAGTGSGILAIAGSCLGAGRVVAIECDPMACATAKRNANVNRTGKIEFAVGDILKRRFSGKFDMITANLFSEILIEAIPGWSRQLAVGGHMILSGILRNQESGVVKALRRNRFEIVEVRRRGKWVAILAKCQKALNRAASPSRKSGRIILATRLQF